MATDGNVPNGPPDFDWDAVFSDDIGMILLNILDRKKAQESTGGQSNIWSLWNEQDYKPLSMFGRMYGNEATVKVQAHQGSYFHLPIAYYSPADNDFIVYPELVRPKEVEAVRAHAIIARREAIADFDANEPAYKTRHDYEDPEVRALHAHHLQLLKRSGMVEEILDAHNTNEGFSRGHGSIEMDEHTRVALSLYSKEQKLCLRFLGSLWTSNGLVRRAPVKFVDIGDKSDDTSGVFSYVPKEGVIDKAYMSALTELAHDLMVLNHRMSLEDPARNFSTQDLGIVMAPRR